MTADAAGGAPGPARGRSTGGVRERKKRRTRMALIDAALELFVRDGYEETTIDEIVAALPVSQRTFFRYFASKEDVVLDQVSERYRAVEEALAKRPAGERPFTALFEALRTVLQTVAAGDEEEVVRFRRIRQVIEATPALLSAELTAYAASEGALVGEIARREGVDPERDLRPRLVVALFTAATRVGFEECSRREIWDPGTIAARVDETVALVDATVHEWI
ncbi:TetR family transcriptional regulator [Actinomadura sp. WMMB 499]|uniref:TetR family transcriptional regulator n=1 Tax=Actinomadura sp. WMMB 499 TaxID=1219491 RepID=UPI001245B1B8|nr:TetR family transcriptional regulator [Actinomadura sp. WMMB 499]QFG21224.1 TetR family transcriptional regulator [Actinomadura sp. WMMB 499]